MVERSGVFVFRQTGEVGAAGIEHADGGVHGRFDGSFVFGDADEYGEIERFLLDDALVELSALAFRGGLEKVENRQGQLALFEVGAEGFADRFFAADEVKAVVIDLIDGAELESVVVEALLGFLIGASEGGGNPRCGGKERAGLHFDDAEVVGLGQSEVEAALGLDDFTFANFARGLADFAADGNFTKVGGESERVGKEGVTEEHGKSCTPFGIGRGNHAAGHGTIDDVVVNERGHVDELEDDADLVLIRAKVSESTADENGERRADAFARGIADVADVRFDGWVEGTDLVADRGLDDFKFRADEVEWEAVALSDGRSGDGHGAKACEIFHKAG